MFRVQQIDHVELFVPDMYDAARWYEHVLGLQIMRDFEEWAAGGGPLMISSDNGDTKLALFQGEPVSAGPTAAFRRVAFRVGAEGFDEFIRRLPQLRLGDSRGEQVTAEAVVDHRQAYSIYFCDPYGHSLEVTTYEYAETTAKLATLVRPTKKSDPTR